MIINERYLQCEKYIDVRRKYLKKYYGQRPSCFKLVQLLSVRNIKELSNLGKYLLLAEKIRNAYFHFISFRIIVLHINYHAPLLVP